jgi:hypothetical protein
MPQLPVDQQILKDIATELAKIHLTLEKIAGLLAKVTPNSFSK